MRERFGFNTAPFTREFDTTKRMNFDFIEELVQALKKAVDSRCSTAVIAPAGTGKTQLIRALRSQLPEARFSTHYIKVNDLSTRDLCREIARALGLRPAGTYPSLVRSIQERLSSGFETDGVRQVLIFDEAHDMRPKGLSMLRLLTNFEQDSKLVVSLVLIGQPSLKIHLYGQGMEDVRQRLVFCGELRLLSREESGKYLRHRVSMAGARKFPFDSSACEALYEISRGNMRAMDDLASLALDLAHDAGQETVGQQYVTEARAMLWL